MPLIFLQVAIAASMLAGAVATAIPGAETTLVETQRTTNTVAPTLTGTEGVVPRAPVASGTEVALATNSQSIVDVAEPLERIEEEKEQTKEDIIDTVDDAVDESLTANKEVDEPEKPPETLPPPSTRPQLPPEESVRPRVDANAQTIVERRVYEVQREIVQEVEQALAAPELSPEAITNLNRKVDAAFTKVERIVKEEKGVSVDTSKAKQRIASQVNELSRKIAAEREKLAARGGLLIYQDSDGDGLSDYDEQHLYGTDPLSAKTVPGELSDGEKIRLGINPLDPRGASIRYQHPWEGEPAVISAFRVTNIEVLTPAPSLAEAPPVLAPGAPKEVLKIRGKGLPNGFVTLYIYSTPIIVTVKTDESGNWEYTLDRELPDGGHSMYVAATDASGKVLARSQPLGFTKRAAAISFASTGNPGESPLGFFERNLVPIAVVLFALLALGTVTLIGYLRRRMVGEESNV